MITLAPLRSRPTTVRAFLLDSQSMVRHGLRTLLEAEPDIEVVGESGDASSALSAIDTMRPDVVVIDAKLQGDGLSVCREIHDHMPGVRTLVMSDSGSEDVIEVMDAGVAGLVLKSISPRALVNSVRAIASGHSLLDNSLTAQLLNRRAPTPDDVITTLTPRERHVLELIGQGLTNRQIATDLHLSEHTVKNHITAVLSKLGVKRRTHAAVMLERLKAG